MPYHMTRHLKNKRIDGLTCTFCFKAFKNKQTKMSHEKTHKLIEGKFPCKACGKVFKTEHQKIIHYKSNHEHGNFPCKHCDRVFSLRKLLISHRAKHGSGQEPLPVEDKTKKVQKNPKNKAKCRYCSKLLSRYKVKYHVSSITLSGLSLD